MEKAFINQLQSLLPHIVALSHQRTSMSFDYDKMADVLYISFPTPREATDTEIINDNILLRKSENEVVGITIMHASTFHSVQK